MSRNNNRFSQINGLDTGNRYDRRHPERKETVFLPGTIYTHHSRIFQIQKTDRKKRGKV